MRTKEEIQAELNEVIAQEEDALITAALPDYLKYIGKCYTYRNSYSLPKKKSDYWFIYQKVLSVTKDDLYVSSGRVLSHFDGIQFQTDSIGRISIEKIENGWIHSLQEEITEKEFNAAWVKLKNKLNELI